MPPVNVSELEVIENDPCESPITRVPRGRPKKERFRKEAARQRVRRAGEIGIEVHGLEPLPPTPSSRLEPVERQVTTPGHAAVLTIEDSGGMVSTIMG
jgi:hypothetical protein